MSVAGKERLPPLWTTSDICLIETEYSGTNARLNSCSLTFHPSAFEIWVLLRNVAKVKGYLRRQSSRVKRLVLNFPPEVPGQDTGRRGSLIDPGSKTEQKPHVYIKRTDYLLALSFIAPLAGRHESLIVSRPDTSGNKPVNSLASLAVTTLLWKWREDHMAASPCRSWVIPQDECVCLYFRPTIAKPRVSPHGHVTPRRQVRQQSAAQ